MTTTQLIRLTPLDGAGVDNMSVTLGWVVRGELDVERLERSLRSVAEKWRLLAGRVELLEEEGGAKLWAIRVPLGELGPNYSTCTFTTASSEEVYDDLVDLHSSVVVPTAPIHLYRVPSTPNSNAEYLATQAPLLSVHVHKFTNASCIGVTVPHGVFDATGLGEILKGLSAKLHDSYWNPPTLPSGDTNPAQSAIEASPSDAEVTWSTAFVEATTIGRALWDATWAREVWYGLEDKCMFLEKAVVESLVGTAKEEVREMTEGREYVSTGDVLQAWFLMAAYSDETDSDHVLACSSMWSARSLLGTEFERYPHNLQWTYDMPDLPISTLHTTTVASLALHNRRALVHNRHLSNIKPGMQRSPNPKPYIPHREWKRDSWIFTNQSVAGLTEIEWPGSGVMTERFFFHETPTAMEHHVAMNGFRGGFLIQGMLRPML
ncbi:hypothetical protein MNV49_000838 [Pseudohyphozyma bogoriensis]|nr:hypothetical protein MNV49_000838 [Pseudohyphozyma bogoriensis]